MHSLSRVQSYNKYLEYVNKNEKYLHNSKIICTFARQIGLLKTIDKSYEETVSFIRSDVLHDDV